MNPKTNQIEEVVLRIQKEFVHKKISEEAKNWKSTISKMVADKHDPDIRRAGKMLEEEYSEIMRTLNKSGVELNLEKQSLLEPLADEGYTRAASKTNKTSFEIDKSKKELIESLIPAEFRSQISILEYIPHVRWEDMNYIEKAKFTKDAVEAEARAIEKGKFDPEPHFANWLKHSGEQERMVRIDFDKIVSLKPSEVESLKSVVRVLAKKG